MQNLQLLFEKLDRERNKKKKVDLMNALAWELKDWDQKRGAQLAQTALELAESAQYEKGIAESMISICQFNFSDYVLALSQSLESLETLEKLNEPAGLSIVARNAPGIFTQSAPPVFAHTAPLCGGGVRTGFMDVFLFLGGAVSF